MPDGKQDAIARYLDSFVVAGLEFQDHVHVHGQIKWIILRRRWHDNSENNLKVIIAENSQLVGNFCRFFLRFRQTLRLNILWYFFLSNCLSWIQEKILCDICFITYLHTFANLHTFETFWNITYLWKFVRVCRVFLSSFALATEEFGGRRGYSTRKKIRKRRTRFFEQVPHGVWTVVYA